MCHGVTRRQIPGTLCFLIHVISHRESQMHPLAASFPASIPSLCFLGVLGFYLRHDLKVLPLSFIPAQDLWGDSGPKTAKLGTLPTSAGSLERVWHRVLRMGFASGIKEELGRWPLVFEKSTPIVGRLSLEETQGLSKFHCLGEESRKGPSCFSRSPRPSVSLYGLLWSHRKALFFGPATEMLAPGGRGG